MRRVIAVASGKGGVGKSTVAFHLAYALKECGLRIGLLDADIHGPSLAHLSGAKLEPVVGDKVSAIEHKGVKLMSIALLQGERPQIMRGPMASRLVQQLIQEVEWGELDYLLIDCPPGTGDIHLSLSQAVTLDGALMVTTSEDLSLLDVRKAIEMFRKLRVPLLGLVENMSYFICASCTEKHPMFSSGGGERLAGSEKLPLLAELPMMPEIMNNKPLQESAPLFQDLSTKILALFSSHRPEALESFSLQWQ